jgi:hypothetical protein
MRLRVSLTIAQVVMERDHRGRVVCSVFRPGDRRPSDAVVVDLAGAPDLSWCYEVPP